MPVVSQFYGIIITMYFNENAKYNLPHLHAEYAEYDAVFDFNGKNLSGKLPNKQRKMIEVWISIHKEELESLWNVMKKHNEFFKIDPLK
ncbi:MAG: DUF4160 domain-containing protein [Clostridia bacterium]|nr:DUF4160 domain-containing protein [Clostridia bacterium]